MKQRQRIGFGVPKFNDISIFKADAVQICDKFWDTQ